MKDAEKLIEMYSECLEDVEVEVLKRILSIVKGKISEKCLQ